MGDSDEDFADAIYERLIDEHGLIEDGKRITETILDMPEIQAIRKYLALQAWQMGQYFGRAGYMGQPDSVVELPASVIAWVVSENDKE